MYTFSKRTPCELSNKLINICLEQFEGPQMIPRTEIGNMFPYLRIFFLVINLSSKLVTMIICDCATNRIFFSFIENDIVNGLIYRDALGEIAQ